MGGGLLSFCSLTRSIILSPHCFLCYAEHFADKCASCNCAINPQRGFGGKVGGAGGVDIVGCGAVISGKERLADAHALRPDQRQWISLAHSVLQVRALRQAPGGQAVRPDKGRALLQVVPQEG